MSPTFFEGIQNQNLPEIKCQDNYVRVLSGTITDSFESWILPVIGVDAWAADRYFSNVSIRSAGLGK